MMWMATNHSVKAHSDVACSGFMAEKRASKQTAEKENPEDQKFIISNSNNSLLQLTNKISCMFYWSREIKKIL